MGDSNVTPLSKAELLQLLPEGELEISLSSFLSATTTLWVDWRLIVYLDLDAG